MKAVLAERERPSTPATDAAGIARLAEPLVIGSLVAPNSIVQAPLAGIGNWAFRRQMRRHGAGLVVSEMVASFGLHHANKRTLGMLRIVPDEHPMAIQLFGAEPAVMAEAAAMAADAGADALDINMGCPVPKICKTGAGAALLDEPERAEAIIAAMVAAVSIPVMVKMRRGVTPGRSRPAEVARRFEAAGAAAIAFHPRAAAEEYSGTADHAITAEVAQSVAIPVIASGDIGSISDAVRVIDQAGCAGVMIGRAALGDPWIYRELAGEGRPRPSVAEVVAEIESFAADVRVALGDERAALYMRRFYAWYLAGYEVEASERDALMVDHPLDSALERLRRIASSTTAAWAELETAPALI